jgi:hypothetical protein
VNTSNGASAATSGGRRSSTAPAPPGERTSRALHDHGVADADVLAADLVVVQRGVDRGADEHRLQLGHRRERADAAHLHVDVEQHGELLLRRVLVRHGQQYVTEPGTPQTVTYC